MNLHFKGSHFLEITYYFKQLKQHFHMSEIPLWLKLLNTINLIPILAWPLIALFSVFLMDNPNVLVGLGSFFLIVSYPLFLIGSLILSFNLYKMEKIILSILVSLSVSFLLICLFIYLFY